jgi:hypothetical protein
MGNDNYLFLKMCWLWWLQIILLPDQERVLTVRENAKLQGFPDYYHIYVPIKEKYVG